MGSPKGAQDVKNTGFWPGIAEMQKKGKISASLDSCVLSYRGVCVNAQSCPTLCDPMDSSPPGSSVHEIFQARILESVAISSSRGSSQHRKALHSLTWDI